MNERHKARPRYFGGVEDRGLPNIHIRDVVVSSDEFLEALVVGRKRYTPEDRVEIIEVGRVELDPLEEADVATSVPPEKGAGVPGLSLPEPDHKEGGGSVERVDSVEPAASLDVSELFSVSWPSQGVGVVRVWS